MLVDRLREVMHQSCRRTRLQIKAAAGSERLKSSWLAKSAWGRANLEVGASSLADEAPPHQRAAVARAQIHVQRPDGSMRAVVARTRAKVG